MPTTALTGRAEKGQNARQDRGREPPVPLSSLQQLLRTTLEHVFHLAPGPQGLRRALPQHRTIESSLDDIIGLDFHKAHLPSIERVVMGAVTAAPDRAR